VVVTNIGGTTAFIGQGSAVTATSGMPVPSGAVVPLGQVTGSAIFAITASGTATVGAWYGYPLQS
jgi:predicted RecA/RadA family phage recombinase